MSFDAILFNCETRNFFYLVCKDIKDNLWTRISNVKLRFELILKKLIKVSFPLSIPDTRDMKTNFRLLSNGVREKTLTEDMNKIQRNIFIEKGRSPVFFTFSNFAA